MLVVSRHKRVAEAAELTAERIERREAQLASLRAEAELDAPDEAGNERVAALEAELGRLAEEHDAALEREDVVDHLAQGQASLARWVRQMRLKAEKVPQDSAVRYHVVVSRQMPGSERLQGMLDARLRRLHQQGLLPLKPGTPVQEMP
mgnify:CR=1 FL=1